MSSSASLALLTLLTLLLTPSLAFPTRFYGVDVSQPVTRSEWSCLLSNNLTFAIVRVFRSVGSVDPNAITTILEAQRAGVKTSGYMFPAPKSQSSGAQQVRTAIAALNASNVDIDTLWFDVEQASYWRGSSSANAQFFESMVGEATKMGLNWGLYCNLVQWTAIFGAHYTFKGNSALVPVWYPHYDGNPSFSDFKPFGGFTLSNVVAKQFSDKGAKCGVSYDINWRPTA